MTSRTFEHWGASRYAESFSNRKGVMPKTKRNPDGSERILGVQVWYRAEQLRPIASTAPHKHHLEGS